MANHNASRSLLSHLCASPKSLQGPVPVCLQAGTAAVLLTSRLASPAIGAHFHSRRSLCLQGDADADKDGAVNFIPRIEWVRERSGGSQEQEEECLLRSEFIKDSSNIDELRLLPLLQSVFSYYVVGSWRAASVYCVMCAAVSN